MKALSSFNALRNSRTIRSRRERTINVNRGALMQPAKSEQVSEIINQDGVIRPNSAERLLEKARL